MDIKRTPRHTASLPANRLGAADPIFQGPTRLTAAFRPRDEFKAAGPNYLKRLGGHQAGPMASQVMIELYRGARDLLSRHPQATQPTGTLRLGDDRLSVVNGRVLNQGRDVGSVDTKLNFHLALESGSVSGNLRDTRGATFAMHVPSAEGPGAWADSFGR